MAKQISLLLLVFTVGLLPACSKNPQSNTTSPRPIFPQEPEDTFQGQLLYPQQAVVLNFEGLKAAGILIKNLNGSNDTLQDCLRVTVGLPEENAAFLSALRELLQAG